MGMGEPLANFDNVVSALKLMLDDHAYGLSRRRVTVSTSGVVPMMDRLGQDCGVPIFEHQLIILAAVPVLGAFGSSSN